jgi:hypothetical protein
MRDFVRTLPAFLSSLSPKGAAPSSRMRAGVETVAVSALAALALVQWPTHGATAASVAPVLLALVHGFLWGATSAMLLLLFAGKWLGVDLSLTWVVVTLLAGQIRDRFAQRTLQAENEATELNTRLERLVRRYEVLRLSHLGLETDASVQRWSLHAACEGLDRMLGQAASPRDAAAALLDLLAGHARVQRAAIYLTERGGKLGNTAAASVGAPLLCRVGSIGERAFRDGKVYMVDEHQADSQGGDLAMPLLTSSGRKLGVLVLHQRGASAQSQLALLRAVAGRFADGLERRARERVVQLNTSDAVPAHHVATHSELRLRPEVNGVAPASPRAGLPPIAAELSHAGPFERAEQTGLQRKSVPPEAGAPLRFQLDRSRKQVG